jgi:ABC-type Co2+ transport system permease subunit
VAVPAMAFEHLLVFGFVEAVVTVLIFRYFNKNNKDFIEVLK